MPLTYDWLQTPSVGGWGHPSTDGTIIWAVPRVGTRYTILRIDTSDDSMTEIATGATDLYTSSCIAGGRLYATPASGTAILTMDLATEAITYVTQPTMTGSPTLANLTEAGGSAYAFGNIFATQALRISGTTPTVIAVGSPFFTVAGAVEYAGDIYAVCTNSVDSPAPVIKIDTSAGTGSRFNPTGGTSNRYFTSPVVVGSRIVAPKFGGTNNTLNGYIDIDPSTDTAAIRPHATAADSNYGSAVELGGTVYAFASGGTARISAINPPSDAVQVATPSTLLNLAAAYRGAIYATLGGAADLVQFTPPSTLAVIEDAPTPGWWSGGSGTGNPIVAGGSLYAFSTTAQNWVKKLQRRNRGPRLGLYR